MKGRRGRGFTCSYSTILISSLPAGTNSTSIATSRHIYTLLVPPILPYVSTPTLSSFPILIPDLSKMPDLSLLWSPAPYHILRSSLSLPFPFPSPPTPHLIPLIRLLIQLRHPPRLLPLPILYKRRSLLQSPPTRPIRDPPIRPPSHLLRHTNRAPRNPSSNLPGPENHIANGRKC